MRMMMKGSDRFMFRVLNGSRQCCRERAKDVASVAGTEEIFARAFRVRHQSEHVTFAITNAGDIVARAVWVSVVSDCAVLFAVAKDDAILPLQLGERLIVANVVAF